MSSVFLRLAEELNRDPQITARCADAIVGYKNQPGLGNHLKAVSCAVAMPFATLSDLALTGAKTLVCFAVAIPVGAARLIGIADKDGPLFTVKAQALRVVRMLALIVQFAVEALSITVPFIVLFAPSFVVKSSDILGLHQTQPSVVVNPSAAKPFKQELVETTGKTAPFYTRLKTQVKEFCERNPNVVKLSVGAGLAVGLGFGIYAGVKSWNGDGSGKPGNSTDTGNSSNTQQPGSSNTQQPGSSNTQQPGSSSTQQPGSSSSTSTSGSSTTFIPDWAVNANDVVDSNGKGTLIWLQDILTKENALNLGNFIRSWSGTQISNGYTFTMNKFSSVGGIALGGLSSEGSNLVSFTTTVPSYLEQAPSYLEKGTTLFCELVTQERCDNGARVINHFSKQLSEQVAPLASLVGLGLTMSN